MSATMFESRATSAMGRSRFGSSNLPVTVLVFGERPETSQFPAIALRDAMATIQLQPVSLDGEPTWEDAAWQ